MMMTSQANHNTADVTMTCQPKPNKSELAGSYLDCAAAGMLGSSRDNVTYEMAIG